MTVLCFFDWSQHLCFRSHGLEAKNEQCAPGSGTDKRQCCQHTSSIHAGSPSIIHTLQWARTFQTHHQSRDYFWKHDTAAAAMQHQEYTYTNTRSRGFSYQHHGQLPAVLVTFIILSMGLLAPSSPSHV